MTACRRGCLDSPQRVVRAGDSWTMHARAQVVTGRFTAEAEDASISLDAPAGWRPESRGPGVVGIGEPRRGLHVQATRRSALADGLSLAKRATQVQEDFVSSLAQAVTTEPEATKIGPHPAVRQVWRHRRCRTSTPWSRCRRTS